MRGREGILLQKEREKRPPQERESCTVRKRHEVGEQSRGEKPTLGEGEKETGSQTHTNTHIWMQRKKNTEREQAHQVRE